MADSWADFLSACTTALHGSGLAAWLPVSHPFGMLLLGLVGGAVHCAGMCGPFVLGQVGSRLATLPLAQATVFTRLRGMALLPYHAGRATTYTLLGAAAAGLAGGAGRLTVQGYLPALALLFAAALLLVFASTQLIAQGSVSGAAALRHWWLARLGPLFRQPVGLQGYGLGLALGFLPCGLLYSALLLAGASGSWQTGALGMAAFALGTMPGLLVVGFLGAAAGQRWRRVLQRLLVPVLLLNAALLILLALRWLTASA